MTKSASERIILEALNTDLHPKSQLEILDSLRRDILNFYRLSQELESALKGVNPDLRKSLISVIGNQQVYALDAALKNDTSFQSYDHINSILASSPAQKDKIKKAIDLHKEFELFSSRFLSNMNNHEIKGEGHLLDIAASGRKDIGITLDKIEALEGHLKDNPGDDWRGKSSGEILGKLRAARLSLKASSGPGVN